MSGGGFAVVGGGAMLPPALRGGALALGNFDGVHRGHQAVIGAALAHARAAGVPALAATFDPHPSRHFQPDAPPFALTSLAQKLDILQALGLDGAVVIPFDDALAALPAAAFMADWLAGRMAVSHVVTGADFTFGRGRQGNAATLAAEGPRHGFTARTLAPVLDGGAPVSSTRVRTALAAGDCATAAALLTRPFTIEGVVIHGDKRGRTIGVPTANLELGDYCRPRYGVYAVRVRLPDGQVADGVANLGVRPMFDPPRELLETWILDWAGDLYGQRVAVSLIRHLRDEARFDGLEALRTQMLADAAAARSALGAAQASANA